MNGRNLAIAHLTAIGFGVAGAVLVGVNQQALGTVAAVGAGVAGLAALVLAIGVLASG